MLAQGTTKYDCDLKVTGELGADDRAAVQKLVDDIDEVAGDVAVQIDISCKA